jgi:hypothetical protein
MEVPNLRRVSILVLVCALVSVAAGIPAAPAKPRAATAPNSVLHEVRGAAHATDYWTKTRMRAARPAPTPEGGERRATSTTAFAEAGGGPYPFTRTEVADPGAADVRMHGKVFFSDPSAGNDYVCSGTAVTSPNESLVWTAGHCVFLFAWHTNFVFVPGYHNGNAPFGEWAALYTSAPASWVSNTNVRQDVGVAVVDSDPVTGATLTDTVGSRGVAFNAVRDQAYVSYGYPASRQDNPDFTGGREFLCTVDSAADDHLDGGVGPLPLAIGCDMTGGSSGGAWVGADGLVYSVNSHGHPRAETDVMDGTYQGTVARSLYDSVAEISVHAMSIGIRLKKHLIVTGTLTADDGFTPCAVGARVEVWRRGLRGWSLLKSERTNSAGGYSLRVKDKTGRYQVVAPAGPADTDNFCALTFSRVLRHRH